MRLLAEHEIDDICEASDWAGYYHPATVQGRAKGETFIDVTYLGDTQAMVAVVRARGGYWTYGDILVALVCSENEVAGLVAFLKV